MNTMKNASYYQQKLDLQPHPEGGFYKQTYVAKGTIPNKALPNEYNGDRYYSTGIFFLLSGKEFSAFHKLHQDEMWHFYDGTALKIHTIDPNGNHKPIKLGRDLESGEVPQAVVPGGHYFGSELADKSSFALVGCTVSPGFDFDDFEMPNQAELNSLFPHHKAIIAHLTRH